MGVSMLILGIDTSGRNGSMALARGDSSSVELLEVLPLGAGEYSAQLLPQLIRMLEGRGIGKSALDAFAVVTGPGSFTGLRVGLATVKGLAEILGKPIASVSMLEVIVSQSHQIGRVLAAMDAGRKEFYVGEYDMAADGPRLVRESLLSHEEFRALLETNASAELVTPDPVVVDLAAMHLHVTQINPPDGRDIVRLGLKKILAGETVLPEALEANYIRRSDAEIFSNPSRRALRSEDREIG